MDGEEIDPQLEQIFQSYSQQDYMDTGEQVSMDIWQIYDACVIPSVKQTLQLLYPLLILCVIFRILCVSTKTIGKYFTVGPKQ